MHRIYKFVKNRQIQLGDPWLEAGLSEWSEIV
jgi:hypothetical protein